MKPEVTIIVPVYNCEKYIAETIATVKMQSFKNWELILVDDCSTDKSTEVIIENIKDIKEKVKFIQLQTNNGVANARNVGLEHADTTYVAYLDSDDVWDADKLKKQIEFMKKNNYEFTYTSYKYSKGDIIKNVRKVPDTINYKQNLKNTVISTSTVMIDITKIPKKLLKMPNIKRGQDSATWWQILKEGYIAHGLNERLSFYRVRKGSLAFDKRKAIKRTWKLYRDFEKMPIWKSFYYFCFYACNATLRRIL